MKSFQLIVTGIFISMAVLGIVLFATFRDKNNVADVKISIWGQESGVFFNNFLAEFKKDSSQRFDITYKQVGGTNFADEVVEAIANGGGPDIVLISASELIRFEDKILPISFETVSERNFKDAFVEGGEIFLTNEGILALPISVDPLVMYWNRDLLQSNGLATPPKFWSELFTFSGRVTEKDEALNITKSAVAMGEYQNINNAKEIIYSLLSQVGNKVISRRSTDGAPRVVLNEIFNKNSSSAESVIRFYTEFSNPTKTSYSWNRALPNSQDEFVSGDLALYFGFASELDSIRKKNPNLNFDVALLPQISGSDSKKTAGDIKGFAVLKRSQNPSVAVTVLAALISESSVKAYSDLSGLPPVRRSLLSVEQEFAFQSLFYRSALITEAFLDPDYSETDKIFQSLIERIVSGRDRVNSALSRMATELNALIVDKR